MYKQNGQPPVPDFRGGDGNFTSVSCMPIPQSAMQTLATLIFDGVFDRFPKLKWGAIELGAAWVPGWTRAMDSAAYAFVRNEEACRNSRRNPPKSSAASAAPRPIRTTTPAGSSAIPVTDLPLLLRLPPRRRWPQSAETL